MEDGVVYQLNSTWIHSGVYYPYFTDPNNGFGDLILELNDRQYVYFNVKRQDAANLIAAGSPGQYFNTVIRDHYAFNEV